MSRRKPVSRITLPARSAWPLPYYRHVWLGAAVPPLLTIAEQSRAVTLETRQLLSGIAALDALEGSRDERLAKYLRLSYESSCLVFIIDQLVSLADQATVALASAAANPGIDPSESVRAEGVEQGGAK